MKTKAFIRSELERAGLYVDEDILDQLVPMCRQWNKYIQEAQTIDPGLDREPAFDLFRKTG